MKDTATTDSPTADPLQSASAAQNWDRYQYVLGRGHDDYVFRAARLDGFYLGGDIDSEGVLLGGGQWTSADLAVLQEQGRPAYEFNQIKPSVNSAIGYQIHNRMDISFRPAGSGADQELADTRSRLAMFICEKERFHYKETQVFSDGLIEQRGYFNIRIRFDKNIQGDMSIEVLDPRDVIPDPDAKGYDPDTWSDVTVTRWLSMEDVQDWHGPEKRLEVEKSRPDEADFGSGDDSGPRNSFARDEMATRGWMDVGGTKRVRVIDRQQFRFTMTKVAVHPTGDIQVIEDSAEDVIADLVAKGALLTKKMIKRVWWTVTTRDVVLYEGWSPFPWFTVLPYFPYFRRGKTRGMVDAAIGAQQVFNKAMSQEIHIVNTTANSGWMVEENSLTNMETEDLEDVGAQSGLVVEYKKGFSKPEKIQPNSVPQGIENLVASSLEIIKEVTVPDAMRGEQGAEISGVAIQSKQFASQQQLAVPLDNLAMTRNMLARRLDWCIANYYDAERVIRITDTDEQSGKELTKEIVINQPDGQGNYLNDMTVGEYDVVVAEVPMQITFENSQFTQAIEIRKAGVNVPDWAIIKHSNLSDKQEILTEMRQPQNNPEADAKAKLLEAQTEKTMAEVDKVIAETVSKNVTAQFSATQTGQLIASTPGIAELADDLLLSGGYVDHNAAPIIPVPNIAATPPIIDSNTSPAFPAQPESPDQGMMAGIETTEQDSLMDERI
jgi:hypothetical protein